MLVAFAYRDDEVDDMDIGDEDGDGDESPVLNTNLPSSSPAKAKKHFRITSLSIGDDCAEDLEWEGSVEEICWGSPSDSREDSIVCVCDVYTPRLHNAYDNTKPDRWQ